MLPVNSAEKVKVLFLIESYAEFNTGIGGHYRSVYEFSLLLQEKYDVSIVTYGDLESPFLGRSSNCSHLAVAANNLAAKVVALRGFFRSRQLEAGRTLIVAVGVLRTLLACELAAAGLGVKVALMKPGGPSPRVLWPYVHVPALVFHQADYDVFSSSDAKRPIGLTAGRVSVPPRDAMHLERLKEILAAHQDRVNVLIVCRISSEKRAALVAINRNLAQVPEAAFSLFHIGVVQAQDLYDEIRGYGRCQFLTDATYTADASKSMHAFDAVCGIGRVIIEGMACAKPVFVPVKSRVTGDYKLCAVTPNNWHVFSANNFSSRVVLEDIPEIIEFRDVVENRAMLSDLGQSVQQIYCEHLSTESSSRAWSRFIEAALQYKSTRYMVLPFVAVYHLVNTMRLRMAAA